jgi:hypothetical protein
MFSDPGWTNASTYDERSDWSLSADPMDATRAAGCGVEIDVSDNTRSAWRPPTVHAPSARIWWRHWSAQAGQSTATSS